MPRHPSRVGGGRIAALRVARCACRFCVRAKRIDRAASKRLSWTVWNCFSEGWIGVSENKAPTLLVHRSKSGHAPTFLSRQSTVERKRKQTGSRDGKKRASRIPNWSAGCGIRSPPAKVGWLQHAIGPCRAWKQPGRVVQQLVSKRAELIRCRHPEAGSG